MYVLTIVAGVYILVCSLYRICMIRYVYISHTYRHLRPPIHFVHTLSENLLLAKRKTALQRLEQVAIKACCRLCQIYYV